MNDGSVGCWSGGFTGLLQPGDSAQKIHETLGESTCDPLQEAISSTEIACRSAEGETLVTLQEHLVRLLDLQYARLSGIVSPPEYIEVQLMNEKEPRKVLAS